MTDTKKIVEWKVGAKDAVCLVGVQGEITAIGDGTITIAGHTLPTRMGDGVRHLSMRFPGPGEDECDRAHCADGDCDPDDYCNEPHVDGSAAERLVGIVEGEHDAQLHPGAFRFCREPLCSAAQEVLGG
jgi:hypothetical protein